tara:strand:+ start:586 stop:867 length:282 start_codon:yes stop_codon:yes gene_type:complete
MATTKAIVKEVNLNLKPKELVMILDALWFYVEDMEQDHNDDLVTKTMKNNRLRFEKVDKEKSFEDAREWYIKYNRLAKQLDRMVIKIRKLKGV